MEFLTHCPLCRSNCLTTLTRYVEHHLVKCRSCSFVFSNAVPTPKALDALYRNYSYGQDKFVSQVTKDRYREILRGFEPYRKHNRLLDVGCGDGHLLSVAQSMGWECFGLEVSPKAVEVCLQKNLTVLEGTLAARQSQLPQCDVVISIEVLEHLNAPAEELALMHSMLRPGGLLYLTTPNFNGLQRLVTGQDYAIIAYPEHLSYFTPSTLRLLARRSGFREKKLDCTGFSFSGLSSLAAARFQAQAQPHGIDENLRTKTESNTVLKHIKALANFFLQATGTGNSLKLQAEKPCD